jgi:hypothetical protein
MKVAIGGLAVWGIERKMGGEVSAGIEHALTHYTRRLRSSRPPLELPNLNGSTTAKGELHTFDLTVAPEVEAELEREAERQHTTLDEIAGHSVMVLLADLDRGEGATSPSP